MMKVSSFSFIKALLITAFGAICGSIPCLYLGIFSPKHINRGARKPDQQLLETLGCGMILLVLLFILIVVILFRQSRCTGSGDLDQQQALTFNGSKGRYSG